MKIMKIRSFLLISFFGCIIVFISCGTSARVHEIPVRTNTVVHERLVPVALPADSAVLTALLECDSLNRVRLVEISELKSRRVESGFTLSEDKRDSGDNRDVGDAAGKQALLVYRIRTVHDTVRVAARDSIVYKDVPVTVEVPVEVNVLTGWQWFQIWTGRIVLVLVLFGAVIILGVIIFFRK
jgi:hypothetical protein